MQEMVEQVTDVNPFEGWVPLEEAARTIGRDRSVIGYWARKGYIQAHQVGKRVKLVNLEEVRAYAATHLPHEAVNDLTTS